MTTKQQQQESWTKLINYRDKIEGKLKELNRELTLNYHVLLEIHNKLMKLIDPPTQNDR